MSSKCAPLARWFLTRPAESTRLQHSFAQIERTLGFTLPKSARLHPAWWQDASANTRHVQALAWLNAGWRVSELDMQREQVVFERNQ